ncbi:MAG TPA: transporter [Thermoanaerobaculia bacterium]
MTFRRVVLILGVVSLFAGRLEAQSLNLRDLLSDFFRQGITLAEPPAGSPFPSHAHHFVGDASLAPLEQLNSELAIQLSTFPLASSAGGFTYRLDPALGVFTRATDSFGPIYADRADTIGKGKFAIGVNFSHFSFNRIDDVSLRDGGVEIVLTHQDLPPAGCCLRPFFEGDVITTRTSLEIQTDITAFTFSYGVTDHLDVGAAIPVVKVQIRALTEATIDKLATGGSSSTVGIHRFPNGEDSETFQQSGSASGVGDVVLRAKYRAISGARAGLALGLDVRLPSGEERDLLGTGATQVKGFLIGSAHLGAFSPHVNGGYTWSSRNRPIPDEIDYTAGFDWALGPRLTFIVDALGRTLRKSQVLREVDTTFKYNVNPSTDPVDLRSTTLKQLVATQQDATSFLGSVGFKINPVGNLLITVNGLFSLNNRGLQARFAPLVGLDYSF